MRELSFENQQLAGEVLAHCLKESMPVLAEGNTEVVQKAARTIRAAFEALEDNEPAGEKSLQQGGGGV